MKPTLRICIIEDYEVLAEYIREVCYLTWPDHDVHVTMCGDVRTALAECIQTTFDLITLDMFLPMVSGMSALALVYGYAPLTPIIVISGAVTTIEHLERYNVRAVLMKPVLASVLQDALRSAVADVSPRVEPPDLVEDVARTTLSYHLLYELFVEALDPIFITDGPTIVAVNKQAALLFGYHVSELLGRSPDMLIAPTCVASNRLFRDHLQRHPVRRSNFDRYAITMVRKSGEELKVLLDILPIVEVAGLRIILTVRPQGDD